MQLIINDSGEHTTVIAYQKENPQVFIDSVNQFVDKVQTNPSNIIGEDEYGFTPLNFCDENGTIIADEYDGTKNIAEAIGADPACHHALFTLVRAFVTLMPKLSGGGNVDDERSVGQALMYGLIAAGPGPQSEIIEDWMLLLDWDHEVEQSGVFFEALHKWNYSHESLRMVALRVSVCMGQHGMDDFEMNLSEIVDNKGLWNSFCEAGLEIRNKLIKDRKNGFASYLWPTYSNSNSQELNLKLVRHCLVTPDECLSYWRARKQYESPDIKELEDWLVFADPKNIALIDAIKMLIARG